MQIEHKLKGYISRLEKIKADGTREVISADIEVPNTIVNLGRRMVSGEWIHRDAGNPYPNDYSDKRITCLNNAYIRPKIGYACTSESRLLYMADKNDKNYSETSGMNNVLIGMPCSYVAISTDGRDTSLDDTFDKYLDSIVKASNNNMSEVALRYIPACENYNVDASITSSYWKNGLTLNDDSADFIERQTFRSVAVADKASIRSVLMCAFKRNVSWIQNEPHMNNAPALFSRIVLPEPIELEAGERLMITYDLHLIVSTKEVLGSMNGINYSIRPYIRARKSTSTGYSYNFNSNYLYSENVDNRAESWYNTGDIANSFSYCYSFPKPPMFYVDDILSLLVNKNYDWSNSSNTTTSKNCFIGYSTFCQSGLLTSSKHSVAAINFNKSTSNPGSFHEDARITPEKPICVYKNIYSANYPNCPDTMIRGLDWQLTEDGKATFESCYTAAPTAGAMNIYGLLAHGAIVCFGKYDENGTWVDEPIVKSATQTARISLKTVWNFD